MDRFSVSCTGYFFPLKWDRERFLFQYIRREIENFGTSNAVIDTTFTRTDRLPLRVIISVWLEVYRTAASVISPEDNRTAAL